ncbi:MAG: type II toxin-antitoxin system Phd/YefM family antitoxin [Pseudomonadota bacterium]
MTFTASDVIPLTQARANLSDLVEQVKAGAEKIITKNGESYVAIIDSRRLDYYHQLERERIHLLLIDDAGKGLEDVAAGKVKDARSALAALKRRRAVKPQS